MSFLTICDVSMVILSYLNGSTKRILSMVVKALPSNDPIKIQDVCNVNMFEWALGQGCPTDDIMKSVALGGCIKTL
jgi:hypothetical protein